MRTTRPVRVLLASLAFALALGCSGLMGETADDDEDGVAAGETGDTGETPDEDEGDDEDGGDEEEVDTGLFVDTGKRGDGKRKKPEKPEKPGKEKPKPAPKKETKAFCFAAKGIDLRFDLKGSEITGGHLTLEKGKATVKVRDLTGSRAGKKLQASGEGQVNGKKKTVKVTAGKTEAGISVTVDGHAVDGAKKATCK